MQYPQIQPNLYGLFLFGNPGITSLQVQEKTSMSQKIFQMLTSHKFKIK